LINLQNSKLPNIRLNKYYQDDEIKKDESGGALTGLTNERCIHVQNFGFENMKKKGHLGDLGIDDIC
jgi:hypothetical protein